MESAARNIARHPSIPSVYRFAAFTLDTQSRELRLQGRTCHIEPRTFDLLAYLIHHRDRVVRKEELLKVVWEGTHVCSGALSQCMSILRRTLGDNGRNQRIIRTHSRIGYRFICPVDDGNVLASPSLHATPALLAEPLRFGVQ